METEKKYDRRFMTAFFVLWAVLMAAAFYFCTLKQGFHEDEFYTYYSTARTNGFYVEDGAWMEKETYRNEFVVLPNERFRYGLVKEVQSWDVHPPMYYWVFHTAASLVPGVFSKWIGLSVNLFFHGINLILLTYLSYLAGGKEKKTAYLATLVYGLSTAAMSGVVFIRMYEMLTVFVLLCAVLHVRAVQALENGSGRAENETEGSGISRAENGTEGSGISRVENGTEGTGQAGKLPVVGFLLPVAAVTYVGFLTQYYYFIFLFYLAIAFGIFLIWHDRNLYNCLRYCISQAAAFVLAYLTYPCFPAQMFKGQRGAQATANFFDLSNTWERFWFFLDLMNGYVFGYFFFVILLATVSLAVRVHRRGGRRVCRGLNREEARFPTVFWMLLFVAAGYFVTVSKTALLLGETSNRYQLPIYGIVVFLALFSVRTLWRQAAALPERPIAKEGKEPGFLYRLCPSAVKVVLFLFELIGDLWGWCLTFLIRHKKHTEKAAVLFCLAMIVTCYLRTDVVFLYQESAQETALAKEQAEKGIPVVYVYRPGEEWCVWAVADVLMAYDRVYFVSAESTEKITEPAIANAEALVAYLPLYEDEDDEKAQIQRIAASCQAKESQLQDTYKYCRSRYYE